MFHFPNLYKYLLKIHHLHFFQMLMLLQLSRSLSLQRLKPLRQTRILHEPFPWQYNKCEAHEVNKFCWYRFFFVLVPA